MCSAIRPTRTRRSGGERVVSAEEVFELAKAYEDLMLDALTSLGPPSLTLRQVLRGW